MTYEHEKAPADAPVTYKPFPDGTAAFFRHGLVWFTAKHWRSPDDFDAICNAFYLAKLAMEAEDHIRDAREFNNDSADGCREKHAAYTEWLRRFDAAKGEA